MALLSGARNCRDSVLSEKIYNRMKILFSDQKDALKSGAILLGNTYSALGDYEKAETIRSNRINEYGKKVRPGLSWTEVDGEIVVKRFLSIINKIYKQLIWFFQAFTAHDRSHLFSEEIHAEMKQIAKELIEHGHKFDGSWITREMHEGETIESSLCGHSEKLAIAFNFIRGRKPSFIQVTKNLRICGDCRKYFFFCFFSFLIIYSLLLFILFFLDQATKLIAKFRRCEIIIRDANRNHHFFPNGKCSCQDHF